MVEARFTPDFEGWRTQAREFLAAGRPPDSIIWVSEAEAQIELTGLHGISAPSRSAESFPGDDLLSSRAGPARPRGRNTNGRAPRVSADFVARARYVAVYRHPRRWALLYRMLWRLTHGEPELLQITIDPDTQLFDSMSRSVRRDLHKMHAFVRFQEVEPGRFSAWYEPDHEILRFGADFFAKRFPVMDWEIRTPDECVRWRDGKLTFSPGQTRPLTASVDAGEELWRTYYTSIFNPARIKVRAMTKELPIRYWRNLPEARLIADLIRNAPQRLQGFYEQQVPGAEQWLQKARGADGSTSLPQLRQAAASCQACGICKRATQTVFGEGPSDARIVLIGEQPGDVEDREGRPFQGPAGQLLNRALAEADLDRDSLYLTNAVKHFKWTPQGKMRLHSRPNSAEIGACKPWLAAEMKLLKPEIIVCLGASAAQSVFGKAVALQGLRGQTWSTAWSSCTRVLPHPSAILRMPDREEQAQEFAQFVTELRAVKALSISINKLQNISPPIAPNA